MAHPNVGFGCYPLPGNPFYGAPWWGDPYNDGKVWRDGRILAFLRRSPVTGEHYWDATIELQPEDGQYTFSLWCPTCDTWEMEQRWHKALPQKRIAYVFVPGAYPPKWRLLENGCFSLDFIYQRDDGQ